jgi:glycosyltransferase involved in cell wall biosynthesis
MKVGVVMADCSPSTGGQHTFEREVYDSLLRLGPGSRHRFQIFATNSKRGAAPQQHGNVSVLPLTPSRRLALGVRAGAEHAASVLTKAGFDRWRKGERPHWLEPLLMRSGVEVMWYPTPGAITTEIPYITIVWDLQHRLQPYFPEVSSEWEWERRERMYATELRRASYIIAGTEVGKAEIERFYQVAPERVRTLPHPTPRFALTPPTDDDGPLLARFQLSPGYLLYPAQFWPHKNHAGLLHALKILKDDFGLTPPLALAGSDYAQHQDYIRQLATDLGLAEQVRFLGFVSQRELVALYRGALATTYVTYFGPENLPPLESFALGCPVIASRVSGAEEQLGDAALLVDPRQPREIAEAIHSLMQDPALRRKLIDKGAHRARRFTGDDFVTGVLQILDEFEQIRSCWGRKSA